MSLSTGGSFSRTDIEMALMDTSSNPPIYRIAVRCTIKPWTTCLWVFQPRPSSSIDEKLHSLSDVALVELEVIARANTNNKIESVDLDTIYAGDPPARVSDFVNQMFFPVLVTKVSSRICKNGDVLTKTTYFLREKESVESKKDE